MGLQVYEGKVLMFGDLVISATHQMTVGEFGDTDEDVEAATGFAEGRAERLIGAYSAAEDSQLFWLGPKDERNECLAVWIEVK